MAGKEPIFKVFLLKPKEACFRLSEDERNNLLGKAMKHIEEIGAKSIIICDSRWSNEEWGWFGVEEYPDIEVVQKRAKFLDELEWFRYAETKTYLGTRYEMPTS